MRRSALALRTALSAQRSQTTPVSGTPKSVLATGLACSDAWDSRSCAWRCQQRAWSNWGNHGSAPPTAHSDGRLAAGAAPSQPQHVVGGTRHAVGAGAWAPGGALGSGRDGVRSVWSLPRRAIHTDSQCLLHVAGGSSWVGAGISASGDAGGAHGGAHAADDGDANRDGVGERPELDGADFRARGLSPLLVRALEKAGVAELFPVQMETLQHSMAGDDLIVRSRTGTGKTLAFVLPIAELLLRDNTAKRQGAPRALILAPTRELAIQVAGEFKRFAPFLRTTTVYGGVSAGPQMRDLRSGVDVVVGTPGRVVDLTQQRVLQLESVKAFVLDEADEMLDMGFADQLEEVMRTLPSKEERQTMLWSATVPAWVQKVSRRYLRDPKLIDLVESSPTLPSNLANVAVAAHGGAITDVTCRVIAAYSGNSNGKASRCLAFCNTKVEVQRMAAAAAKMPGVRTAGLSGDLSQQQRESVLADFRAGRITCVFATDVAARGLDIPNVETVVHVRPATQLSAFTHRSGRTARAGATGTNVVVFNPRDAQDCERLSSFQEALECEFKVVTVPPVHDASSMAEDAKRKLRAVAMATATTQRQAQVDAMLRYLTKVEPEPAAQVQMLAKALLHTPDEATYSLLSGESGFVTVMLDQGSPDRRGQDTQRVLREGGLEADIVPEWRSYASGAVFDVPQRLWPKVEAAIGQAVTLVAELPPGVAFDVPRGVSRKGRGNRGRSPPMPARSLADALRGFVPGNNSRQQQRGARGGGGGRGGARFGRGGGGGGGRRFDDSWGDDGGWGQRRGGGGGGGGRRDRGAPPMRGGRGGGRDTQYLDGGWGDDRRGGGNRRGQRQQGRGGGGGGGGGRGRGGGSWGDDSGKSFGFGSLERGMGGSRGGRGPAAPRGGQQDDFSFGAYRRGGPDQARGVKTAVWDKSDE